MSSRVETSGSSNASKRNLAQSKQDKKKSAPIQTTLSVSKRPATSEARTIAKSTAAPVAPEDRQRMIQEAAYFLAEKRGFWTGNEMNDWLQAEAEIDARNAR